ncbi:hypothetical protein AAMO2058_000585600 [Amorphochlora amoebiformis]
MAASGRMRVFLRPLGGRLATRRVQNHVQFVRVFSSAGKKKFKLPISLMGLWWMTIWGVPLVAVVGYYQVPTRLRQIDVRYKDGERDGEKLDETKDVIRPPREKVPLTKSEELNSEKPWETYGVSKTRYREMQRKNDVNMHKIQQIIKNTSKKGPSAWNE